MIQRVTAWLLTDQIEDGKNERKDESGYDVNAFRTRRKLGHEAAGPEAVDESLQFHKKKHLNSYFFPFPVQIQSCSGPYMALGTYVQHLWSIFMAKAKFCVP